MRKLFFFIFSKDKYKNITSVLKFNKLPKFEDLIKTEFNNIISEFKYKLNSVYFIGSKIFS